MHTVDFQRHFFEESEVVYTGKSDRENFNLMAWREDGTIIAVEWNKKECYFHVFPKDKEFKAYLVSQGFEKETDELMERKFQEVES